MVLSQYLLQYLLCVHPYNGGQWL
ncbi:unnamed protein product [Ectocarpus sp. CCAP 1310/34]|nr:unnamed protein product [Ectocarpus sp. CCAP 1310/34]